MIYFIPTILIVIYAFLFIYKQKGLTIVQMFVLISVSYLNIFPAIDILYNNEDSLYYFSIYQLIISIFFEIPLLVVLTLFLRKTEKKSPIFFLDVRLNPIVPYILFLNLGLFLFISWRYDLFFVRLGYADFQYTSENTPFIFLYFYRSSVETSFFVILFLTFCLRYTAPNLLHRNIYRACLISFLIVFTAFYAVNSRMQFVLLMLVLVGTNPNFDLASFKRIASIGLSVLGVAILLTLARELYIEQNDRLEAGATFALLQQTIGLIAARLNSVVMINRVGAYGFDPFGIDLSGLIHFLKFNLAFFNNAQLYAEIKSSELTSPSVVIVNRILYIKAVDFPKSMIVDVFLSFGVYGLSVLSLIIGYIISKVQTHVTPTNGFTFSFIASLYLIPILLQFEKEFLGFLISCVKWVPLLFVLYWFRPKQSVALRNKIHRDAYRPV